MIRIDKLRGAMAEKGITGKEMATIIGVTPKTFYEKMKKGVFGSDEIEKMVDSLDLEDPVSIFFGKE